MNDSGKSEGRPTADLIKLRQRITELEASERRLTQCLEELRTEHRQTEQALRRSEEMYRGAIVQAGAVPYRRDYQTDTYTFMGDGILAMTGYSAEEMTPKLWDRLILEASMRRRTNKISYNGGQEGDEYRGDCRIQTRSGEARWIADSSIQIRNDRRKLVSSVGMLQDITERKEAEEKLHQTNLLLEQTLAELQEAQQQVIRQERLRVLGQMASGVAHDFNNSLTPILGFTEVLLKFPESLDNRQQTIRYLQMMRTAAQDASSVVKRLREFYRLQHNADAFDPVNLNRLVEQVIALTRPKWKDEAMARGLTIALETELAEVPTILGNESELREAITNLIFNAVDAMEADGRIALRTHVEEPFVVLQVSDSGCGMTREAQQRCFEPFFSTKQERGAGLGLSIVSGTIENHDGKISVDSELGEGSTFTVRLPIRVENKQTAPSKQIGRPSKQLRVLLVDDEKPVRTVVAAFLEGDGHTVEQASDGREGSEKFRSGSYDVVITDLAMPEVNGDQLAGEIKEMSPQTPVIMLTGFGDIMEGRGHQPEGVDHMMSKPVTLAEFRQVLANIG